MLALIGCESMSNNSPNLFPKAKVSDHDSTGLDSNLPGHRTRSQQMRNTRDSGMRNLVDVEQDKHHESTPWQDRSPLAWQNIILEQMLPRIETISLKPYYSATWAVRSWFVEAEDV
ncbi:uncharacterized protein PADG_00301 [Paracoccidioides brasiliensis Pb18]|uniref:Uncharacterized protein n=2 Tax=Paracoccidioides brasiliensis TaxID=121759 RepID=C1G0B1_PARBD|nr:uncharacterized protein PADG_00301 [Paracoccidioides brasiliensis Pb18]EEH44012.2 hypothetical protein PADG_00301 [Paracoccidioides brasiliensis Pb18]ODH20556.1 hypothetical protein ACO22_05854 [Paracoccidioides brasiliensis]ODH48725.1 hypothetical protein GX48_05160 [Paracoccidioides brasiliensis]